MVNLYLTILVDKLIRHLARTWYRAWRVLLRIVLGKKLRDKLLETHIHPYDLINLSAYVSILRDSLLVKTRFPDGVLVIPIGCINALFRGICSRKVYNRFHEVQDRDVVIDVGAHVGVFTLRAAKRAVEGRIIAIEPHPFNYKLLTENVKQNKLKNVVTVNTALSDHNGTAKLYVSRSTSHSIVTQLSEKYLKTPVKKLDSLVDELNIKKVNMIKINAEGSELEILKGSEKMLKKTFHLAIQCGHTSTELEECSRFLTARGFKIATFADPFVQSIEYLYAYRG